MKRLFTKKVAAVAVTAGLVLGGGGIAFAYFTSNGGGSGSASVGSSGSNDFTITSDGPSTALLPGNGAQPFDFTATNTGSGNDYLGTVYLSVDTFDGGPDAATVDGVDIPGCDASWFTITPSFAVDSTVPSLGTISASDVVAVPQPTITMADSGTDQDACQGASVGIAFSTTP